MNFALLGYILALVGVLYSIYVIGFTFYAFTKLSDFQKSLIESINLGKEIIILVVSLAYIITYHIS